MAFTDQDDFNVLQASDSPNVGAGKGNDTYVLSEAKIADNQEIDITDTEGENVIKLVGGLEIASSKVASDTAVLTLNNGAEVTVRGASRFSFDLGGDILGTGDVKNFTDFSNDVLNVALPAEGDDAVEGEPATIPGGESDGGGDGGGETVSLTDALSDLQAANAEVTTFLENALDNDAVAEAAGSSASAATSADIATALDGAADDLGTAVSGQISANQAEFTGATDGVKDAYINDATAAAASAVTSAQEALDTAEASAGTQLLNAMDTADARTASYESALVAAKDAANELVGATASFDDANSGASVSTNTFTSVSVANSGTNTTVTLKASGSTSLDIATVNSAGDLELTAAGTSLSGFEGVDDLLTAVQGQVDTDLATDSALENLQDSLQNLIRIDNGSNDITIDWTNANAPGIIPSALNSAGEVEITYSGSVAAGSSEVSGSGISSGEAFFPNAEGVASARTALTDAEDAQSGLADAVTEYNALTQLQSDYEDLVTAADDAEAVITDSEEDGGLGVSLLDGAQNFTISDDVYIFSDDSAGENLNGFGLNGEDNIFFGEQFSLTEINDDGIQGDNGDANALEIFLEQDGNDVNLFVEDRATGGNGSTQSDLTEVTLASVDANDIQDNLAEDGFLTAGTAADIA